MGSAYPPAPWRLRGEALIVPTPVAPAAADADPGRRARGRLPFGGILLARYESGSTLAYHELIAFSGLASVRGRLGFEVGYIAVDSPASLAGGRAIWGLPKRLADFTWRAQEIAVAEGGADVLRARVRRRLPGLPLAIMAPFFGELDHAPVRTVARGRLRAAPALVDIEIPAGSPLADRWRTGRRAALHAAGLRLLVPAPRRMGSPAGL